jgi:hypothetical protein
MPNKTIYLNTLKGFEASVGFSFIDGDDVAKKLQEAWKKDKTQAKVDYLAVYREIFRDVLKKWSDNELSLAFQSRSATMPNFKQCLLKTDETLKLCAMSLLPELRENEDVLSHMTFGVIDSTKLKDEFVDVRKKYLQMKASENAMKKRKVDAYNKYKDAWFKTTTRKITELVNDKQALSLMSQEEKIDYALALEYYRDDDKKKFPFSIGEKDLIDDALRGWNRELGCTYGETLEEFVSNQYFQYAQTLGEQEWLENQVNEAIAEYNSTPNPAKEEIARYKEIIKVSDAETMDDVAEMVGDFFKQEELTQEIAEMPLRRERVFLQDKVTKFNEEYSLKINHDKVRTSVEQLSALMIKAREEKQRFLDENSVVVIENGKETCYDAKEYYKDTVYKANKAYMDEIQKIEQERQRAEQEHKTLLNKLEKQAQILNKDEIEQVKLDRQKVFQEKEATFNKALAKAKEKLQEELSAVKGGIVIEKDGNTEKQYKSKKYYETHETQKEQYAYGQYQQMYSRIYKDACKSIKEKNYSEGKVTDFSHVAKDVDDLFKSAMYLSNVYDNDKNLEIVQKCSFGGLSAERLASFAAYIDGDDWTKDQYHDTVWQKQSDKARKILAGWNQEAKTDKKVKPSIRIKQTLENRLKSFNKGEITRKQLLDYMVAGEAHLQRTYPSNFRRVLSFIQYNRVENSLQKCRAALGITANSSLRIEMNLEYIKLASSMNKEQIFKSVETRMGYSLGFNAEKMAFEKEHKVVQDRELARKKSELESLKSMDKEPFPIPELDERKLILNQEPRVKPIAPVQQQQPSLNVNK